MLSLTGLNGQHHNGLCERVPAASTSYVYTDAAQNISIHINITDERMHVLCWLSSMIMKAAGRIFCDQLTPYKYAKKYADLECRAVAACCIEYGNMGSKLIWDAFITVMDVPYSDNIITTYDLLMLVCIHTFLMLISAQSQTEEICHELHMKIYAYYERMITNAYLMGDAILMPPVDIHYICMYADSISAKYDMSDDTRDNVISMCTQWTWKRTSTYTPPHTPIDTILMAVWCSRVYCITSVMVYPIHTAVDISNIPSATIKGRTCMEITLPRIDDGTIHFLYKKGSYMNINFLMSTDMFIRRTSTPPPHIHRECVIAQICISLAGPIPVEMQFQLPASHAQQSISAPVTNDHGII